MKMRKNEISILVEDKKWGWGGVVKQREGQPKGSSVENCTSAHVGLIPPDDRRLTAGI